MRQFAGIAITVIGIALAVTPVVAVPCTGRLESRRGAMGNKTGYEYTIVNTTNPPDPNCNIKDFTIFHPANNTGGPITINACRVPLGWSLQGVDDVTPITGDPIETPSGPVLSGGSLGGFRILSDDANPPAADASQGSGYKLSFANGTESALQDNAGSGGFHTPRHSSGSTVAVTPANPSGSYRGKCEFSGVPALGTLGTLCLLALIATAGVVVLRYWFMGQSA